MAFVSHRIKINMRQGDPIWIPSEFDAEDANAILETIRKIWDPRRVQSIEIFRGEELDRRWVATKPYDRGDEPPGW